MPNCTENLVDGIAVLVVVLGKNNSFNNGSQHHKLYERSHSFTEHILCARYYFSYWRNNGDHPPPKKKNMTWLLIFNEADILMVETN